ncbi:polysaccharide biosynthesis protein, partial [Candidatus Zixiibacteriota bacterium]
AMNWSESSVLLTGGTGSFGKKFTEILLSEYTPKKLTILSRDELKQHEMRTRGFDQSNLRYLVNSDLPTQAT